MDGRAVRWLREEEEREANRRALQRGARQAAGVFIAGLRPWDLFGTLTYDRRRCQQERILGALVVCKISTFTALRHGRLFLGRASKALQRPLPAVLAVEAHMDGSAHLHGLFDVSGLGPGDIKVLWSIWYKEHGYIRLEQPSVGLRRVRVLRQVHGEGLQRDGVQPRPRGAAGEKGPTVVIMWGCSHRSRGNPLAPCPSLGLLRGHGKPPRSASYPRGGVKPWLIQLCRCPASRPGVSEATSLSLLSGTARTATSWS